MSSIPVKPNIRVPHRAPTSFQKDKELYTVLCPQMAPIHFALMEPVFRLYGYRLVVLPTIDRNAIEEGLRYVNNDVCYPAIVVVGQLIQALKTGQYDLKNTALLISQTCGGCRSTNYATFLRIAAAKAGFGDVPVLTFNVNVANEDETNGISLNLAGLKKLLYAFLFGDLLLQLSNRCRPYETVRGAVDSLVERWIERLRPEIVRDGRHDVSGIASRIVGDFENLELDEKFRRPRVGIVGEILVKYHPGANNDLVGLIEREGGEAVVPNILDYMMYCLTSDRFRKRYTHVPWVSGLRNSIATWAIERQRNKVRKVLAKSRRFAPSGDIHHLAELAESIVSTCNQSGEGWLLTGEMVELIEENAPNIVCVQPFGCLPNHITGKGVMKELRSRFEKANITTIDYDPGSTEVNQLNRIKLLMAVALRNMGLPIRPVTPNAE